jgi:signal transduction histidine kinase
MAQVLANLIGNAVIHGEPGSVIVALDGNHAQELRFAVSNRGRLPETLLPRIFEPFKGADKPCSGLGLGLYIVDQFVRAHGGEVVAGNDADGARFEARLPRRPS